MSSHTRLSVLGIGFAIFSMFFGAGNSIFPLYIGVVSQNQWFLSLLGLSLTAVVMPILGVYAMLRADGNPQKFFGRIGRVLGLLVATFVISLLGPLGSTPRCIALSYATLVEGGAFPISLFALLSCGLIFLCTWKKEYILSMIGYVLTPLLLLSLVSIIGVGIFSGFSQADTQIQQDHVFKFGLLEGYKTMDLLAAFFFSSTILHLLAKTDLPRKKHKSLLLKGGIIGGVLLALVYGGFSFIAASHADALTNVPQEYLLKSVATILLGLHASFIVRAAISLACLTTAIALIAAFTDFVQTQFTKNKVPYAFLLLGSLAVTYCVSIFEFAQISEFLTPVLNVIYPGLIFLTIINTIHKFHPNN